MSRSRRTCATLPLRWGSGNRFPLDRQRNVPKHHQGLPILLPPSAMPWEVARRVVATTEWPYGERWSASSWLGAGGGCLSSAFPDIKEMNGRCQGRFYQRVFNKTNHCVSQVFLSTLETPPKSSSYFNCCNFPSHPKIELAVREEQRASVNAIFICCYCFSFINL